MCMRPLLKAARILVMLHAKPAAAIKPKLSYRRRFPREIMALAVWLSYRFALSPRMVEEMLAGEFASTDACA